MVESKRVNGHKYWLFGKFYEKEKAFQKALDIRRLTEGEKKNGRFRYLIEEITAFGDLDELFIPGVKYHLWVNQL